MKYSKPILSLIVFIFSVMLLTAESCGPSKGKGSSGTSTDSTAGTSSRPSMRANAQASGGKGTTTDTTPGKPSSPTRMNKSVEKDTLTPKLRRIQN